MNPNTKDELMILASIMPWFFIDSSAMNETNVSNTMNKKAEHSISEDIYALYWLAPVISTQMNKKMSMPPTIKKVSTWSRIVIVLLSRTVSMYCSFVLNLLSFTLAAGPSYLASSSPPSKWRSRCYSSDEMSASLRFYAILGDLL